MDIRKYFPDNHLRELHLSEAEAFVKDFKEVEFVEEEEDNGGSYKGYRSRRGRGGSSRGGRHSEPKAMYVPKNLVKEDEFSLEDCNMAIYLNLDM